MHPELFKLFLFWCNVPYFFFISMRFSEIWTIFSSNNFYDLLPWKTGMVPSDLKKECMLYITTVYCKFATLLLTLELNSFRSHELVAYLICINCIYPSRCRNTADFSQKYFLPSQPFSFCEVPLLKIYQPFKVYFWSFSADRPYLILTALKLLDFLTSDYKT